MRLPRNRTIIGGLASAAVLAAVAAPATPAQAQTDGTTTVTVAVAQVLTLTDLTAAVTLSGEPGETVLVTDAVSMTVSTNNLSGYTVTVVPNAAELTAESAGNTDTIPFSAVEVENATGGFESLDPTTPVTVHTQATPSDEGGDTISRLQITIRPWTPTTTRHRHVRGHSEPLIPYLAVATADSHGRGGRRPAHRSTPGRAGDR